MRTLPIAIALMLGVLLGHLISSGTRPAQAQDPPPTKDLKVTGGFQVGPNTGAQTKVQAPIDVYWDEAGRKLHARSLILTEVDDPVDLRIRRAPGKFPDGPVVGTSPAGTLTGGIHWDVLTSAGWRQVAGIEGMAQDLPAPAPTPPSHPGWLTIYTYPHDYDDRVRRVIFDDTGSMSLGGGGYGGEGLPAPRYGFHLFGGGLRVQAVAIPEAPTLSVVGQAGTTRYSYQIVARDSKGNSTMPGPAASIVGPDKLDGQNGVRMRWSRCEGAETYQILRNGQRLELEFRGEGTSKTYVDSGAAAVAYQPVAHNRSGDAQIDGALTVKQGLHTPGKSEPPALTGDQDNFAPAGLVDCSTLGLRATAPVRVSGLAAPGVEGRWLLIVNVGDAPITLVEESDRSQAANRFADGLVLQKNRTVVAVYTFSRWRLPMTR
jgi:hypothetical protein